jgi:hypothetical protein
MNGTVLLIFLIQTASKQLKLHLGQFALRYAPTRRPQRLHPDLSVKCIVDLDNNLRQLL